MLSQLKKHPLVAEPHAWFKEHGDDWDECFRKKDPFEIVVGCMDPRLRTVDLRYPGLGVFEKMDVAAQKIAALQQGIYGNCRFLLQTHDDCRAAARVLSERGGDPEDANELAYEWGEKLVERVIKLTGNNLIKHGHVPQFAMDASREIESVYIDCTDRFNPTDKVANGPTVSLLAPGDKRFMRNVIVRNLAPWDNGLSRHLGSSAKLMLDVICEGRKSKPFAERQLTAVLIRDTQRELLSNTAQRLVEEMANEFGHNVKVLPVDEKGRILGRLTEPSRVLGCP